MPGFHLVATDGAGWNDGLWETHLYRQRGCRNSCHRLTAPSTEKMTLLLHVYVHVTGDTGATFPTHIKSVKGYCILRILKVL